MSHRLGVRAMADKSIGVSNEVHVAITKMTETMTEIKHRKVSATEAVEDLLLHFVKTAKKNFPKTVAALETVEWVADCETMGVVRERA